MRAGILIVLVARYIQHRLKQSAAICLELAKSLFLFVGPTVRAALAKARGKDEGRGQPKHPPGVSTGRSLSEPRIYASTVPLGLLDRSSSSRGARIDEVRDAVEGPLEEGRTSISLGPGRLSSPGPDLPPSTLIADIGSRHASSHSSVSVQSIVGSVGTLDRTSSTHHHPPDDAGSLSGPRNTSPLAPTGAFLGPSARIRNISLLSQFPSKAPSMARSSMAVPQDWDEVRPVSRHSPGAHFALHSETSLVELRTNRRGHSPPGLHATVPPSRSLHPLPSASTHLSAEGPIFFPMTPAWTERYVRQPSLANHTPTYVVPRMQRTFENEGLPYGWDEKIHPEGLPYFYDQSRRLITDAYIYEEEVLSTIEDFFRRITTLARSAGADIPGDAQLVLELMLTPGSNEVICGYYFVDHVNRLLFWLQDFDVQYILKSVRGHITPGHFKAQIESEYWAHCEYFPGLHPLASRPLEELRTLLIYSLGDSLTSLTSLSPYSAQELESMLRLVDSIDRLETDTGDNVYVQSILARLLRNYKAHQFLHFHGQKHPRMNSHQSLHPAEVAKPSMLFKFMSFLLFFGPAWHRKQILIAHVDGIVYERAWAFCAEKMRKEWDSYILIATVLLTVDVSLLTIQSVDVTDRDGLSDIHRSFIQISAYISITVATGSLITGLILTRHARTQERDPISDVAEFLRKKRQGPLGHDLMAIVYSLPYALLMWGAIAFGVAFLSLCFVRTALLTRVVVGVSTLFVFVLILWSAWDGWESDDSLRSWFRDPLMVVRRFKAWFGEPTTQRMPQKPAAGGDVEPGQDFSTP